MSPLMVKTSRTLHWVSSALALASICFFSLTGVTLNHPDWFKATPQTEIDVIKIPAEELALFKAAPELEQLTLLTTWLQQHWQLALPKHLEKDEYDWLLDYQRPGGITSIVMELETGEIVKEDVDDGVIALINDLHKGRHSGAAWSLYIDIISIICLLFSITGFLLLLVYARKRSSTWPLITSGALIPLALFWWFVP